MPPMGNGTLILSLFKWALLKLISSPEVKMHWALFFKGSKMHVCAYKRPRFNLGVPWLFFLNVPKGCCMD